MNHIADEIGRRNLRRHEGRMDRALHQKRHEQLKEFLQKRSDLYQANLHGNKSQSRINSQDLNLPDDLLFKIFLLLHAESLTKVQFVSKKWFSLINSPIFIEFHTKQTETVLISRELFLYEPSHPVLPPETHPLIESVRVPSIIKNPTRFFHFVDFDDGSENFIDSTAVDLVNVFASCNGLILGKTKESSYLMVVMNPLTRKHVKIPSGTIGFDESYSLVFCGQARTYKVVHLFREKTGYTGCEIFDVKTRKWRFLDGPSSDLLGDVRETPLSVDGSLFWMPKRNGGEKYLSMNVWDEKFVSRNLPVTSSENDRLVELGGVLGFATHVTLNLMNVWILPKSRGLEEKWIKRHSIYLYQGLDLTRLLPICSSRNGKEMVFEYVGGDLYAYDFEKGVMKKICSRNDEFSNGRGAEKLFVPHRNTLVWLD